LWLRVCEYVSAYACMCVSVCRIAEDEQVERRVREKIRGRNHCTVQ